MPASRSDSVRPRRVSLTGMLLLAAGSVCALPAPSSARPASVPDCLRPPKALASAAAPTVLVPPGARSDQLMAQALPPSRSAASTAVATAPTTAAAPRTGSARLLAQAPASAGAPAPGPTINGTELLPACTYDPPVARPQIIRGLW